MDRRVDWADGEIDNLRGAFTWSLELSQIDRALELASALHPLWVTKGRFTEGLSWFDTVLDGTGHDLQPALRGLAMADRAALDAYAGGVSLELAEQALAIARDIGDQKLTVRALTAYAGQAVYRTDTVQRCLDEGIDLARESGEGWWLRQLLGWRAFNGNAIGDLGVPLMAAEEGCALAEAAGDGFHGRIFRLWLALAQTCLGDLAEGNPGLRRVLEDADAAHDPVTRALCLITLSFGLTYQGDLDAARVTAEEAIAAGSALGGYNLDTAYAVLGLAAFAAGDPTAARIANEKALHHRVPEREPLTLSLAPLAEVATACGDLAEARRWADTVVSRTSHWHLMRALSTRARVTLAQGEPQQAERDVYDALAMVTDMQAHLTTPDLLETLAVLTARTGGHREAARLFGAAHAMRQRIGVVRFKIDEDDYLHQVAQVRTALGDNDFEAAWDQGPALSTEEVLAYAQRGRGERKRPASGWESLTPTERGVVQLVSDGLANKDVATRLFISPRTVQTHLTHVYAKLGLASRIQLIQEAARH